LEAERECGGYEKKLEHREKDLKGIGWELIVSG